MYLRLRVYTYPKSSDGLLLPGTQPRTRVVVLFVWLVGALGVADLRLQIVLVLVVELTNTVPAGPLCVWVYACMYVCVCVCENVHACLLACLIDCACIYFCVYACLH